MSKVNGNVKLASYLVKYKKQFIFGPLFKLTESVFELLTPIIMASIVDRGVMTGDRAYIFQAGGVLIALTAAGVIFALTAQYIAASASQSFGTDMRDRLFRHIQALPEDTRERFGASSLTTRLTSDINNVQHSVAMFIRMVLRAPCLMIGAAVMALIIDAKLATVFIVAAPLIVLTLYVIMKRLRPLHRRVQKTLDASTGILRENLVGTRVVRAFAKEERESGLFSSSVREVATLTKRVGRLSALLSPLTSLIINGAIIAILYFGGMRVEVGGMTPGEVIAFSNYANQILLALVAMANFTANFTRAGVSWGRVKEVMGCSAPTALTCQKNQNSPTVNRYSSLKKPLHLEIQDLCFAYPGASRFALENVSFTALYGEKIGIIGGTGSGKSTLAEILTALRRRASGRVTFGGVDIDALDPDALRRVVRLAPQTSVLFSGTVEDNLRWGKVDATEYDLERAIGLASAGEFVSAANGGLKKPVARGGRNFSGGQKQRLNIARAVIGEPDILILDDCFSALDYATEAAVRRGILEAFKDKTVIIISQRTHSVQHADRILVLENGGVAGLGTHTELMATCDVYREIYASQASEPSVKPQGRGVTRQPAKEARGGTGEDRS